jgi:hypothetical protein
VEGLPLFGVEHFGQRQNVRLYASKCMLEFMPVSYVYVCIVHAHTHVDVCMHRTRTYAYDTGKHSKDTHTIHTHSHTCIHAGGR